MAFFSGEFALLTRVTRRRLAHLVVRCRGPNPSSGIINICLIQAGYKERRYSATSRVGHNLSVLLKGLELRASVSLSKTGYNQDTYITFLLLDPSGGYDFETGEHFLTM